MLWLNHGKRVSTRQLLHCCCCRRYFYTLCPGIMHATWQRPWRNVGLQAWAVWRTPYSSPWTGRRWAKAASPTVSIGRKMVGHFKHTQLATSRPRGRSELLKYTFWITTSLPFYSIWCRKLQITWRSFLNIKCKPIGSRYQPSEAVSYQYMGLKFFISYIPSANAPTALLSFSAFLFFLLSLSNKDIKPPCNRITRFQRPPPLKTINPVCAQQTSWPPAC